MSLRSTHLRWSLNESYNALVQLQTADIILSTGSSVAAVNLRQNARCYGYVSRPSPVGTRYFDLAILPMISWHHASRLQLCRTIGVPNPISPDSWMPRKQLKDELKLSDCPRIGILLGGTDRLNITIEDAERLSKICGNRKRMNAQNS